MYSGSYLRFFHTVVCLHVALLLSSSTIAQEQADLASLICQSLATPYEEKQDRLRANNAKSLKKATTLIGEGKNEEARRVLQEMLALEGRKKLTTRESQMALFFMANSYRVEDKSADAINLNIEFFFRDGKIQACTWETCSIAAVALGEAYKAMRDYEPAKTIFSTVEQCPESFTVDLISKANLRLFEIASEQADADELKKRGRWLLNTAEGQSILNPELTAQISAALDDVGDSSVNDQKPETTELNPVIVTEQLCESLETPYEKKKDSQLRNRAFKSLREVLKSVDEGRFDEARSALDEMLAATGRKKLNTTETQYVFMSYGGTFSKERVPSQALQWHSKIYRLDNRTQPCSGSSLCAGQILNTGSFLKGQLMYPDAKEWLQTVDQCPSFFSDETQIKMIEGLFEIALATEDIQGTNDRGAWLLERASQSHHIDAELQGKIREALKAGEEEIL